MKRWILWAWLPLMLLVLIGCGAADEAPTATVPMPTPLPELIAQELQRGRLLLAKPIADFALEEGAPLLAPEEAGAEGGFGLRDPDGQLEAYVYVYADPPSQTEGLALLTAALPAGAQEPLWATNDSLLLLVVVAPDADLAAARSIQTELLAALAGAQ